MKYFSYLTLTVILLFSITGCRKNTTSAIYPCDTTKHYSLIWHEEFNHSGLPDTSTWKYEEGFVRNHESQYYTVSRPENTRMENGILVIESRKESYKGAGYTSGSINSLGKISFPVNSRVEVRAKLPSGEGIWPAIWMMGTDINDVGWPRCGEIDIMEFLGRTPGVIYGTFHWASAEEPDSVIHLSKGDTIHVPDVTDKFHVYGVERTEHKLRFFVDNHYYFDFNADSTVDKDLFNHPFYLLLNTAVGGDWGGRIDDSIFPQKLQIDWVRVFKID
jgi:beta-glucanase (GH16 family)